MIIDFQIAYYTLLPKWFGLNHLILIFFEHANFIWHRPYEWGAQSGYLRIRVSVCVCVFLLTMNVIGCNNVDK